MRNPNTCIIVLNRPAADALRKALGDSADVIHMDTVPTFGAKRRYETIFMQWPDDGWMDLHGFFGSEQDTFVRDYVGECSTWLTPTGSIIYL